MVNVDYKVNRYYRELCPGCEYGPVRFNNEGIPYCKAGCGLGIHDKCPPMDGILIIEDERRGLRPGIRMR
jgi:hypothetical protein